MLNRVAIALLVTMLLAGAAEAQRRRLPSRTEPIPDTETGRQVGTPEPANPSMMIYGPPVPPLGAPPAPPIPVPEAKPAPVIEPTPAPVVAPALAPPAPVAVPIPAPAPPPPPVAAPAPVIAPTPAPVAKPIPPPPEPVAIPIPEPAPPPPPVAAPAPAPQPIAVPAPPPPVAAPAPAPPPQPIAAPSPPPPPPAPVAAPAPAPIVKPTPVVKPAPEKREVATVAPAAAPAGPPKLDAKLVEQIFSCLAPGLPPDWKKTWVVVSAEAAQAPKFYVTTSYRDEDAEEFVPCNAPEVARRITGLNETLTPGQRRWTSARLLIDNEGAFALNYEYAK